MMNTRRWLAAGLLICTAGCATTSLISEKPRMAQQRDHVECTALAEQGSPDRATGLPLAHLLKRQELYRTCLESRGWIAQPGVK
jgi:hypothetical protein